MRLSMMVRIWLVELKLMPPPGYWVVLTPVSLPVTRLLINVSAPLLA